MFSHLLPSMIYVMTGQKLTKLILIINWKLKKHNNNMVQSNSAFQKKTITYLDGRKGSDKIKN
jgi:hypothetical protein